MTSPRDAALRLARDPGLAWLDGGLEHGHDGRFSFVASCPCETVRESVEQPAAPFELERALSRLAACEQADEVEPASAAPFRATDVPAWVGHVAFDARSKGPVGGLPAAWFARHEAWYAFDHAEQRAYLVGDSRAACERLAHRLAREPDPCLDFSVGPIEATEAARHARAVREALALIREGEVYEINLARRYRAPFTGAPLGLFLRMREASPVPLGYYVDAGEHAVLGRSMECFLRYDARTRSLRTSPIKGTLARLGDDGGEADALRADPKERAEHAMVVDLMRNDLSRVCEVGSVQVRELMAVLPFAGLSHMISTIEGRAREGVSVARILAETFPPGSVTGAPKERVLQAIAELERVPRGLYCGCYGVVDRAGGCSFAVAIRTAVVRAGEVEYFAGGGIVADSVPEREVAETDLKAAMFLRAARGA